MIVIGMIDEIKDILWQLHLNEIEIEDAKKNVRELERKRKELLDNKDKLSWKYRHR